MQDHPAKVAQAWFIQAREELSNTLFALEGERYALCCFLAQQTAEKALKALLIWIAGSKPRTHLLVELRDELRQHQAITVDDLPEITILDQYYVSTRYPDALAGGIPAFSFVKRQAKEAYEIAADALRIAHERLPIVEG